MDKTRFLAICATMLFAPGLFIVFAGLTHDPARHWPAYQRQMVLYRECPDGAFLYEGPDGQRYAWRQGWVRLPEAVAKRNWCPLFQR